MAKDYNRRNPVQGLEEQVSEDAIKIFYSYSRNDLDLRNALEKHLSPLKKAGRISTWHDLELEAGTEWELKVLPTHAKPITSWTDRDEAFAIVAQHIRITVNQLITKKLAERQAEEQRRQHEQERLQREQQRQAEEQERQRQAERLKREAEAAERQRQELERQRLLEEQQRQEAEAEELASAKG